MSHNKMDKIYQIIVQVITFFDIDNIRIFIKTINIWTLNSLTESIVLVILFEVWRTIIFVLNGISSNIYLNVCNWYSLIETNTIWTHSISILMTGHELLFGRRCWTNGKTTQSANMKQDPLITADESKKEYETSPILNV